MRGERHGSGCGGAVWAVLPTGGVGVGTMVGIVVGCGPGGVLCPLCRKCIRAIVRVRCGAVGFVEVGVDVSPFEGGVCWGLGLRLSGVGLGCHGKVVGSTPGVVGGTA